MIETNFYVQTDHEYGIIATIKGILYEYEEFIDIIDNSFDKSKLRKVTGVTDVISDKGIIRNITLT